MINYIIACIFITMAISYFYVAFLKDGKILEELVITGLFAVMFVAYCFIFSNLGFINIPASICVPAAYLMLNYAGTKSTLRFLNKKHSNIFDWLLFSYCLITGLYIVIELILMSLAIQYKSNYFLSIDNLIQPIYNGIIVLINFMALIKAKEFTIKLFLLNFTVVNFSITLYEIKDYNTIINNYSLYSEWGKYYIDPTYKFDVIWILINCFCWLFLPRVYYKLKGEKNG